MVGALGSPAGSGPGVVARSSRPSPSRGRDYRTGPARAQAGAADVSRRGSWPHLDRCRDRSAVAQRRDGPDDPRHQLRRAARGRRRQARQRLDQLEHVAVIEAAEQVEQPQDRRVRHAAEQLRATAPARAARAAGRARPRGRTAGRTRRTTPASRAAPRARRRRGRPRTAAAASAAFCSRTATTGSPSRTLRSAMTRPNHCQWSPTAR